MTPYSGTLISDLMETVERHELPEVSPEMRCPLWPDCPFPKDDHIHDFRDLMIARSKPSGWNSGGCEHERVLNSGPNVPERGE